MKNFKAISTTLLISAFGSEIAQAKKIDVKDQQSAVIFSLINDESYLVYKQCTRGEAEKLLTIKFTFSDEYKQLQKRHKPKTKLRKLIKIYDQLMKLIRNYDHENYLTDYLKQDKLILQLFENNFTNYKMTENLLTLAVRENNLTFISSFYQWATFFRVNSTVINDSAQKIINKLPQLTLKKSFKFFNLQSLLNYVAANQQNLAAIKLKTLEEIKNSLEALKITQESAINYNMLIVFDYLIARHNHVSKEQYFANNLQPLINNTNDFKTIVRTEWLAIILNFMVNNDKNFQRQICQKNPQILTLDLTYCPWLLFCF